MKHLFFSCLLIFVAGCLVADVAGYPAFSLNKKIIDLSWSNPTIDFLSRNLADMEKDSILDGVTIRVSGKPEVFNGKKVMPGGSPWGKEKGYCWKYESFQEAVATLKKLPFKKFTDNFYYCTTTTDQFDWFNDEDWKPVLNNFRIAAKVSKAANLKGLLFDLEEYGKLRIWHFDEIETKHSLAETSERVYLFGKQVGNAVFAEYPDIVLFMPFFLSFEGELTIPFVNGLMAVMPPEAHIVSGHEYYSYTSREPSDYKNLRYTLMSRFSRNVYPENRAKFFNQVSLGPAFYMDAVFGLLPYWSDALKPDIDKGIIPFMRRNLAAAIEESDRYIWFYSEKGSWWNNTSHRQIKTTWQQRCPDLVKTIAKVKNLEKIPFSSPENKLNNGDFSENGGFSLWQIEKDQKKPCPGSGSIGNGKAVLRKITRGCFDQRIATEPGKYYFLRIRGKNTSKGRASCKVNFLDKNKKWLHPSRCFNLPLSRDGKETDISQLFTVPKYAYTMSVQLSVINEGDQGEVTYTGALLLEL